ncbi:MAG: VOC family protein, partial [Calditrichota bacterium]
TQVGIVVEDVAQAARSYADVLGMEVPEIRITDPYEKAHTRYNGVSTGARAKLAFFRLKNITIELIEPVDGPSTWQEFLQKEGPGVHHIAFQVDGMEQNIAYLQSRGGRLIQQGDFTGGSYAYVDATQNLAVILELLTSTD